MDEEEFRATTVGVIDFETTTPRGPAGGVHAYGHSRMVLNARA